MSPAGGFGGERPCSCRRSRHADGYAEAPLGGDATAVNELEYRIGRNPLDGEGSHAGATVLEAPPDLVEVS